MDTRKSQNYSVKPSPLSPESMHTAITKLKRRMSDLEAFDPSSIRQRNDPRIEALEAKIKDTISEIFGSGTSEYRRFAPRNLDNAGYNLMHPTPLAEVIQSVADGKQREITNLQTIIDLFLEKLDDEGQSPTIKVNHAFESLNLHPDIARACSDLFMDGHYAEAVENGCKALDLLVKLRSLRADPSGTELMQLVFSPKSPILKFSSQTNDSERSEQQGMMFLFSGAMLAIRNPRAHGLLKDHPESAIEYLSFLSMLAKSLDRTTI